MIAASETSERVANVVTLAAVAGATGRRRWVGEVALGELCQRMPGFAGLALWLRHVDRPDETRFYAATDGLNIFYGKPFRDISLREQYSTQAHEVLHAALCHPARVVTLATIYKEEYSPRLANVAADALVNSALGTRPWFQLSDADPTIETVMAEARDLRDKLGITPPSRDPCDRSVREWSLEALYGFLHWLIKEAVIQGHADAGVAFAFDGPGRMGGEMAAKLHPTPAREGIGGEGLTGGLAENALDERIRAWSRRLNGIAAGRDTGSIVQALNGDLPQVRTPWEHHLCHVLASALAPAFDTTWTRPNRRGADAPGYLRTKPVPKLIIVQDTSGSVDERLRRQFAAEIRSISRRRGATVTVISADAEVTEIVRQNDQDIDEVLRRLQFIGGGGTSFEPAIAAAAAMRPDALVYLTDLYGTFGPAPKFPVIWAVPEMLARSAGPPPFGHVIPLT